MSDDVRRPPGAAPALVYRRDGARGAFEKDALVVEEPLEIRLREGRGPASRFVVTMRTPGDDADLAVGLLHGEGVIASADEVVSIDPPDDPRISAELARNVVVVTLAPAQKTRAAPRRATVMGSACGVCGKTSIEDVLAIGRERRRAEGSGPRIAESTLVSLPERLRAAQAVFASTGALHAAGLFSADGSLVLAREDVGRHNATDKAFGALLRERRPVPEVLLVSGRLAFEIVQKAVFVGVPIICAVSAPTSLAVELAEEAGVTLVGFLRGERFNAYAHPERIGPAA